METLKLTAPDISCEHCQHTIEQAVSGLLDAFKSGRLPNSLNDPRYFNIKMMQNISLK